MRSDDNDTSELPVSYTKIYYCHHCVGETLHYRDDSDGMWTCPSCGRWSS